MSEFPPSGDDLSEPNRKKAEAVRKLLHEPHRLEAEYHERRRNGDSSLPEDITVDQYREDRLAEPADTDVHAENVGQFKSFMRGAVEKLGGAKETAGKGYEASAGYLAARAAALGEAAKELGPQVEKIVRKLGAEYNKLNWKQKVAIGVGLAGVAAAGTALTGGGGLIWSLGATGWWRVLSGSGTFVALDGVLSRAKETRGEHWWNKHAKAYAATAGALVGGTSFAIAGGEAIAHSAWLADMLGHGHHAAGAAAGAAAGHAGAPAPEVPQPAEVLAAQQAAEHAASAAPAAPELAPVFVEAHAGDGGIKLFKHLQEAITKTPGFDPNHLTSVQEHILHGDPTKLAEEYGLYKPNEALESAKVFTGSTLGFDAHGDLILTQHGAAETLAQNHGYEGAFVHAGHQAGAAPEHAQLHEVRARLGITEEQQTAELNRMSLEAHQAIDHPPPAPLGPEAAPPAELAPSAPHELAAPPVAEHAPSAHLEVNANHLAIDTGGAHQYLAHDGAKVVFGGSSEERAARAAAWVARDHQAVVYFDRETKDLFGLRTHHHLMRMTWRSLSGNEIGPLGEPAAPIAVEQPYLEEVLPAAGRFAHVPSIDDLQAQVPDVP